MSEEKPIGRIEQLTDKPAITAAPAQDYPKVVMVTQAELDRLRILEEKVTETRKSLQEKVRKAGRGAMVSAAEVLDMLEWLTEDED